MPSEAPPALRCEAGACVLTGAWILNRLTPGLANLRNQLQAVSPGAAWDLSSLGALDTFGALLLWRRWGRRIPDGVTIPQAYAPFFELLARHAAMPHRAPGSFDPLAGVVGLGRWVIASARHVVNFVALLGHIVIEQGHLLRNPGRTPWREISANLYKGGVSAMPVVALVAFLVGVVLSYLFALQLKRFGAESFIVDVLGIGIIRELGPVLVAVLVAGRSGSAMTAQLGTMRVTEEIDALATLGVPRYLRLVFPKVVAMSIAMPLLVAWTCAVALLGGIVSAHFELGLDYSYFLSNLRRVVPYANLWIALAKGVTFGIAIALIACYFGLRVKPNTESLSNNTTRSVVSAVTVVILLDAVFALAMRNVGLGFAQ